MGEEREGEREAETMREREKERERHKERERARAASFTQASERAGQESGNSSVPRRKFDPLPPYLNTQGFYSLFALGKGELGKVRLGENRVKAEVIWGTASS